MTRSVQALVRRHGRFLAGLGLGVLTLAFLSVNAFPSINNDGVEYIAFSQALTDRGLVHLGYRQIGYPLVIGGGRLVSVVAGVEALLFTTLIQRLLLALASLYAVWLWRWRAIPVLLIVITPSFMAYTNLIMTEGVTVSLALLMACLVAHHFRSTSTPQGTTVRVAGMELDDALIARSTAWAAAATAFILMLIRFPFAVFGVVPLAMWLAARRRGRHVSSYRAVLVVYLLLAGALTVGLAVENREEFGAMWPNARTERSAYWSAWQLTFTLHPENQSVPALDAFYDDGSPYPQIWDIEANNSAYVDQAEALEEATDAMLSAAGFDPMRERLFSFLGALRGGRLDEIRPRIDTILATDASSVDDAIHVNNVSTNRGRGAFNNLYNYGHKPQAVITSPMFPSIPAPYVSTLLAVLLPLSLLGILVFGVARRRTMAIVVFVVPVLVYSALLAWFMGDTVRFLMTTSVYAIAGACAVWSGHHAEETAP